MKAFEIVREILDREQRPVITDYDLKLLLRRLYAGILPTPKAFRRRSPIPSHNTLARLIEELQEERVIRVDPDFGSGVYQVFDVLEQSAEAVCAEVDPCCYISHQSAMQRYGLSNRNPAALVLTTVDMKLWREERDRFTQEHIVGLNFAGVAPPMRRRLSFPEKVRRREVLVHETKYPGSWQQLADSRVRIATIGQTFVDTITHPAWCGGMSHVLEVWDSHAEIYRDEIITVIESCPTKLVKVRAGYLLSERLNLSDARVEAWQAFAQRGSSQKLDPERPYAPTYSERWMLSLNV